MQVSSGSGAEHYVLVDLARQDPPASRLAVIDPKISVLPFGEMSWEDFERLLLDVAQTVDDLVEARRYGVSGQNQGGVDVFGRSANGTWSVYQAKRVAQLSRAQVRAALDDFVTGRQPFDARRLVIATACRGTRTEVSDLIYEYRVAHPSLEFDQVWDAEYLGSVLRQQPRIVGRYFGDSVAWRFCDADVLSAYHSAHQAISPLGVPLDQADPFALGIHEAIDALRGAEGGNALPPYVRRPLDAQLEAVVQRALGGDSAVAILVGDSATGKTRAAWEALRTLPAGWRIWHPRSRDEVLDLAGAVEPHTVVWLDEAKDLLLSGESEADERVAAALGRLVRDPASAPVLVLGTSWHEHWTSMAAAPGVVDDRKQTRTLLGGHRIEVPEYFSGEEIAQLLAGPAGRDARLREAAERAEDRHIVQYLAGGPAQLQRYEEASPAARAVLDIAIDASRLGRGFTLTERFLEAAAESSLTGLQRDLLPDDWFESVITYTSAPCRGARGVLSRARRRLLDDDEHSPGLRLADYVEQVVSRRRAEVCPPDGFWIAAERFAATARDRFVLVSAALARGRLEAAERLAERAAELGESHGLVLLGDYLEKEFPEQDSSSYLERAAENGNGHAQIRLAARREDTGRVDEAERWYRAAIDSGERPDAAVGLASVLWTRGEHEAALDLYEAALADGHARSVEYQARHLAGLKDHELALALTRRSFEAGNTEAFTGLAWTYMSSDHERAIEVFHHAIEAGDVNALREMTWVMEKDGKPRAAEAYCDLAVAYGEINALRGLGMIRASRGDTEGARALLWRAYNAGMDWVLPQIGELHEKRGALRQAERIYRRSIRELGRLSRTAVTGLLRVYESTGRHDRAYALAMAKPKDFLPILATVRAKGDDRAGAERLLLKLVDAGHPRFLVEAASMRKHEGDLEGARRMLRRARDAGVGGAEKALREF